MAAALPRDDRDERAAPARPAPRARPSPPRSRSPSRARPRLWPPRPPRRPRLRRRWRTRSPRRPPRRPPASLEPKPAAGARAGRRGAASGAREVGVRQGEGRRPARRIQRVSAGRSAQQPPAGDPGPRGSRGGPTAGFAPPPQAALAQADKKAEQSPFDTGLQSYRAGRFDDATRTFDGLAASDPNADLWAARAVRESKGCRNALARFDRVARRAGGTAPGWDALLEGALCYRAVGDFGQARVRLTELLKVDSHKDRAQAELDRINQLQQAQGEPGPRRRRGSPVPQAGGSRRHALPPTPSTARRTRMKDRDALVAAWSPQGPLPRRSPRGPRAHRRVGHRSRAHRRPGARRRAGGRALRRVPPSSGASSPSAGGSPTLASATLDHAADVLDARSAAWLVPARAAVAEGFAAALVESAQLETMRTWEFPSCAVPLGHAGARHRRRSPVGRRRGPRGLGGARRQGRRPRRHPPRGALGRRARLRRRSSTRCPSSASK